MEKIVNFCPRLKWDLVFTKPTHESKCVFFDWLTRHLKKLGSSGLQPLDDDGEYGNVDDGEDNDGEDDDGVDDDDVDDGEDDDDGEEDDDSDEDDDEKQEEVGMCQEAVWLAHSL